MKIEASINEKVTAAMEQCREVIIGETINLLKQMGVELGQELFFEHTLFLCQTKDNVIKNTLINNIVYLSGRYGDNYYIVSMKGDKRFSKSDIILSLNDLQLIYNEVCSMVKKYKSKK